MVNILFAVRKGYACISNFGLSYLKNTLVSCIFQTFVFSEMGVVGFWGGSREGPETCVTSATAKRALHAGEDVHGGPFRNVLDGQKFAWAKFLIEKGTRVLRCSFRSERFLEGPERVPGAWGRATGIPKGGPREVDQVHFGAQRGGPVWKGILELIRADLGGSRRDRTGQEQGPFVPGQNKGQRLSKKQATDGI